MKTDQFTVSEDSTGMPVIIKEALARDYLLQCLQIISTFIAHFYGRGFPKKSAYS